MIATWYNLDSQEVTTGQFSLLTKSLCRACIDVMQIYGGEIKHISFEWALIAVGDRRVLVSAV